MSTVGIVNVGFKPAALIFEVIRLEGCKTAHEVVHGNFALQGLKDLLRAPQVSLYFITVIVSRYMHSL